MSRLAVIAHFSHDGMLNSNFMKLLEQVSLSCEKIRLISTGLKKSEFIKLPRNVETTIRDNVGYDFFSYKTGIMLENDLMMYDEILILNDSFFIGEKFSIERIIESFENLDADICGLTSSYQYHFHIQSYFMLLKKSAIMSVWFNQYWENISVLNSKMEIVFNYEIALTQSALSHGLIVKSLFDQGKSNRNSILRHIRDNDGWFSWLYYLIFPKYIIRLNPVHYSWKDFYESYHVIKWEVVRFYKDVLKYIEHKGTQYELSQMEKYISLNDSKYSKDSFSSEFENEVILKCFSVERFNEYQPQNDVVVVLHLFYVELLSEIMMYLKRIPYRFDLFVSVVSHKDAFEVKRQLEKIPNITPLIYITENQGRDVGPFVKLYNTNVLNKYLVACKIHSKKSKYSSKGDAWRQQIFQELFPSINRVKCIIDKIKDEENIGLIGPEECYLVNQQFLGASEPKIKILMKKMKIDPKYYSLGFFGGTMFWFKPNSFRRLSLLENSIFEVENGLQDGTYAHAVERLFGIMMRADGYKIYTNKYLDEDVSARNYQDNKVIVL